MEWFWIVLSAILAGVGTGLAGLSAATVMVPILIVLCPSFAGETGVYQATAIALASDILGSAVTSAIYIKNKNIDLKRGWIMLVCIVSMCALGSIAAWMAGNVVLGGFTLFLTFVIGIRFLLKPDTQRKETISKGTGLGIKEIIISLFFGLTIGFGAGFVGSGGGMMMLVVFTAFLGMDLKSAVGTSTLIMTFTALIASVSHILIHPAIVLEKSAILIVCIIAATIASLVSAQFANKVSNRTVGLVTGAVLTVLGAMMIILNYWDSIQQWTLLKEVLVCFGQYVVVLLVMVSVLLCLYLFLKVPKYIFRELLHGVAFLTSAIVLYFSKDWLVASLTLVLFSVIVYPILVIAEKWNGYTDLFVQKKKGEVKLSLLQVFLSNALLLAICGGIFQSPELAIIAILMWGMGDASAAIIGIPYGKHHIQWPLVDHKKTWEGSLAMLVVSTIIGSVLLIVVGDFTIVQCILVAIITSCVGTYTEMISHGGIDTITVSYANAVVLLLLTIVL